VPSPVFAIGCAATSLVNAPPEGPPRFLAPAADFDLDLIFPEERLDYSLRAHPGAGTFEIDSLSGWLYPACSQDRKNLTTRSCVTNSILAVFGLASAARRPSAVVRQFL